MDMPTADDLMWPVVKAMQVLGGKATTEQIYQEVIELENFDKDFLDLPRKNKGNKYYQSIGWAKTRCRNLGLMSAGEKKGIWILTDVGKATKENDIDDVAKRNSHIKNYFLG